MTRRMRSHGFWTSRRGYLPVIGSATEDTESTEVRHGFTQFDRQDTYPTEGL